MFLSFIDNTKSEREMVNVFCFIVNNPITEDISPTEQI